MNLVNRISELGVESRASEQESAAGSFKSPEKYTCDKILINKQFTLKIPHTVPKKTKNCFSARKGTFPQNSLRYRAELPRRSEHEKPQLPK